jgi:glycine hydroxymethyltransferase
MNTVAFWRKGADVTGKLDSPPRAPAVADLVASVAPGLDGARPLDVVRGVLAAVQEHDGWRRTVVNLIAAEGLMSRTARSVLSSDLASRLTEGLPGAKDASSSPPESNRHIEQIEVTIAYLARCLFGAEYAEWRPASNTMANAAVLRAVTRPGDLILVQSMSAGANVSYHAAGVAGLLGVRTADLPGTREFGIDADAAAAQIGRLRPRVIVVGGSKVLFPYPLRELRQAADQVGALVLLDAAHVAPLIAAGRFGDPLADGAHVLTLGTHKAMGGPVGGLVLTNDQEIARRVSASVYPGFLQTRDQNKYAAAAIGLAELLEHRDAYAAAMVSNARELGGALESLGLSLVGAHRGYSDTHMLVLDVGAQASGLAAACCRAGVLLGPTNIVGDTPGLARSGVRLSVAQVTRQGMGTAEMRAIAHLMDDARQARPGVPARAAALARSFPNVCFSFDSVLA